MVWNVVDWNLSFGKVFCHLNLRSIQPTQHLTSIDCLKSCESCVNWIDHLRYKWQMHLILNKKEPWVGPKLKTKTMENRRRNRWSLRRNGNSNGGSQSLETWLMCWSLFGSVQTVHLHCIRWFWWLDCAWWQKPNKASCWSSHLIAI